MLQKNHQYISTTDKSYKQVLVDWVSPHFKLNDYAITLTYKENTSQHKSNYQPNLIKYSGDISHYLNCINRNFLGRNKSKSIKLSAACHFELTAYKNIHIHLILQKPPIERIPEERHKEVLTNTWVDMYSTGNGKGVQIVPIHDVKGWVSAYS